MATIGTSIAAVSASNYLTVNNENLTKSIKRLSSGSRLADPVDDAAGVAVSGNLDARIKRLAAAVEGAQNVVSYGQTVDGFMNTLQNIVTRLSELAQRSTNGAFSSSDRLNYQTEFGVLTGQIQGILSNANFNGNRVFNQEVTSGISVAIDASANVDSINTGSIGAVFGFIPLEAATSAVATNVGFLSNLNQAYNELGSTTGAVDAISSLNASIASITTARANVNADISKFNFYIANIRTEKVNVEAANSRIKDLNVADESTNQAKQSILVQAATAMLSQANTTQNIVLQLLQG
jgi:flagellin